MRNSRVKSGFTVRTCAMASLTTLSGTPDSLQRSRTWSPLAGSPLMELSHMITARRTRSKASTRSAKISAQGRLCPPVCVTRAVPRPRTHPRCSVGKRWSHTCATGSCSNEVNTWMRGRLFTSRDASCSLQRRLSLCRVVLTFRLSFVEGRFHSQRCAS